MNRQISTTLFFEECIFCSCTFSKTEFKRTSFINVKFIDCSFNHVLFNECNLDTMILQNCKFLNSLSYPYDDRTQGENNHLKPSRQDTDKFIELINYTNTNKYIRESNKVLIKVKIRWSNETRRNGSVLKFRTEW